MKYMPSVNSDRLTLHPIQERPAAHVHLQPSAQHAPQPRDFLTRSGSHIKELLLPSEIAEYLGPKERVLVGSLASLRVLLAPIIAKQAVLTGKLWIAGEPAPTAFEQPTIRAGACAVGLLANYSHEMYIRCIIYPRIALARSLQPTIHEMPTPQRPDAPVQASIQRE